MLAFLVRSDGEDWSIALHAKSRGQAKHRFTQWEPSGFISRYEWNSIRTIRIPSWDDKPFTDCLEFRQLFEPDDEDEQGNGIYNEPFINFCLCDICKGNTE